MIIMIAAASENNALGKKTMNWFGTRFQEIQKSHFRPHIIIGRKHLKVLKPLPNRTHSYKSSRKL
jgi:dihydrofolate reductase